MNFQIIRRTIGWLLLFEAIFFLVPLITAVAFWEWEFFIFLACIALCVGLGLLCVWKKPKKDTIYAKEGLVIVALSWVVMSIFGCLPFIFSGSITNFIDALFETVSGFTTTGATILSGEQIEGMSKSLLMWRSFTHWVGGMGVLVFIMAFLPLSGARNMYLMKAESPGPTVGKLVPKVRTTAKILYVIYFIMTVLQFILLLCDGSLSVYEALNAAFSTAGTGGFFIKADSLASTTPYVQVVVTVFMLLFSINFNSYYLIGRGKIKEAFNVEVRWFLYIVFGAIALITLNVTLTISEAYNYTFGEALRYAAFSVASVVSTTGMSTADFDLWPLFSKSILIAVMFIGACAGSTGGGIKVSRVLALAKGAGHEVRRMIHPNQVKKISLDKRIVEDETVRSINAYIMAYIIIYVISMLLISFDCPSFEVAFTSVVATLNNVGPGLGAVGPSGNFAFFSGFSKIVFIFNMLAGRLEIFPMLVLFFPGTWHVESIVCLNKQ
jgi:trk system potassium uptake protein TrkH